tara:strand:+ start:4272 stop:4490 length:219 start_codon:yes stop_codon:yes gene_type:complete
MVNDLITYRETNGRASKEELEKLGRKISECCLWIGDDIITVFQSALEDANYHRFNKSVSELWNDPTKNKIKR